MPALLSSRPYRALVVLGLVSLVVACGKKGGAEGDKGGQPPATVTTAQVQPVRWSDELKALGTANARESVTITASVSQTIASVEFDSGQNVKKGQPLVTLVQDSRRPTSTRHRRSCATPSSSTNAAASLPNSS